MVKAKQLRPKIGGHYSNFNTLKDLQTIVSHAKSTHATAIQLILGNEYKTTLKYKPQLYPEEITKVRTLLMPFATTIHSNLTINLGNPPTSRYRWMLDNVIYDMQFCAKVGAVGVIVHTGFQTHTKDENEAIANMIKNIQIILAETPKQVRLIIETSAGQRNRIATDISELAYIYEKLTKDERNRVSFCIDSCHIFTAGYPIDTIEGIKKYFGEWDKKIGLDKVIAVHLNDSKNPLGSRNNKHENLLEGYIFTKDSLGVFLSYVRDKIIILETRSETKYKREVELVDKLIGL
jgi:deoxyribonuclease-4